MGPREAVDLNGEFHFKVDAKGRVALPAKFRKVLTKDLVVTLELGNECVYQIISAYLLAFSRSIAEVGAVSMVGGAISWKTNVMTTAIMQYTNRGNFTLGVALGLILLTLSLIVNIAISLLQRRLSR